MKITDIPIVLHTMDSYDKFWNHWFYFFKKYCKNHGTIYFLSENKEPDFIENVIHIKTGKGEWGERLLYGLSKINDDLIFYMQEDFWPHTELIMDEDLIQKFNDYNMDQLHIKEILRDYCSVTQIKDDLYRFNQLSDYTHNHQFGLWKKNKLIENVLPEENPWQNELYGTRRLNKKNHNVYIIDKSWYTTVARKGMLMERGKELLKKHNL